MILQNAHTFKDFVEKKIKYVVADSSEKISIVEFNLEQFYLEITVENSIALGWYIPNKIRIGICLF